MQPKPGNYVLYLDGGMVSSGRRKAGDPPGEAAIGVVLRSPKLQIEKELSERIGPASHNIAEYSALIEGLKIARRRKIEHIRAYMDSELVVDQMNGRSDVKADNLRPLCAAAKSLAAGFKTFRISWIPRELNREADQLAKDALKDVK